MNKKIILALILSTFLGCSPIPKIAKNEIITPGNISTDTLGNQKLTFSNINWWKMYNDPVLDQLIDFALKENEDLKIAKLNSLKADEAVNLAKSGSGITINLAGDLKREKLGKNGTTPPPFGGKIINIGSIGLQADYNIDLFNKVNSLATEQKYKAEALKLNSKWIELDISNKVTRLYLYWKYLYQENTILNEQKKILTEIEKLQETNLKIGNCIEDNILTVQDEIRATDMLIKENELNKQLTINNLNILSSNKNSNDISSLLQKNSQDLNIEFKEKINIPSSISSDVIINRPDVEYYLMLIKGQEKHLDAAKADFYPQFSITGQYGFEGINFNKILRKDSLLGFIGPSIYLPIFHSGAIKSTYKIAGTDMNIFIEEYNKAIINAYNDVDNELYKTKTLWSTSNDSDENFKTQTNLLSRDEKRLEIGTISKYDYLSKKYSWYNNKLDNEQQHFNLYTQQLQLINSLGGVYKLDK